MATSLAQLRTEIRTRADITYSNSVTDTELTAWINDALRELHTLLGAAYPDRYLKFVDFTITSGSTFDPLTGGASDFWKIRGVDYNPSSTRPRSLKRVSWSERNQTYDLAYRDRGHLVEVFPASLVVGKTFRLWYLPKVVTLSADGDQIDQCQEDWREFLIAEVAAKALEKDEDNEAADRIRMRKQELRQTLEGMIQDDVGAPAQVGNMFADENDNPDPWWP